MAITITIKLREIEAEELLRLVGKNIKSGEYWGAKDQYYKRMNKIKANIEYALENQVGELRQLTECVKEMNAKTSAVVP